jgi:hypothetical protein
VWLGLSIAKWIAEAHKDWFLPLPLNLVEPLIISERDDISCQDHDISVHCRRQHSARVKFKMRVAISDDSHAVRECSFEHVFLKFQVSP